MKNQTFEKLYGELEGEYRRRFPRSAGHHNAAKSVMVDGGQHTLRLYAPFPVCIQSALGAYVDDLDDHHILDFWQGHYANILGHNPPLITQTLNALLSSGYGLQTGMVDESAHDLAALICRQTGAERVRFTTSGSLATMYALMLARSFTGRDLVLKVGGGWHGGQPWGLVGVSYGDRGYLGPESEGLPLGSAQEVRLTRYNDSEALEQIFRQEGERIACFIVEPVMGAGGAIPARPEYLGLARQLTEKHGALLILDEVISGFRFRAGNAGKLYGLQPDLTTMGKIIGGGMPVAAVAGRADVIIRAGREGGRHVRFDGGTYSAHPASIVAGKTMLTYLVEHEEHVYGRLTQLGRQMRARVERIFADHGILVHCTGHPNEAIRGSSMAGIHFPTEPGSITDSPESVADPATSMVRVRERILKLAFLLEDVYTMHGLGALSAAHTEKDLDRFYAACGRVAQRLAGKMG